MLWILCQALISITVETTLLGTGANDKELFYHVFVWSFNVLILVLLCYGRCCKSSATAVHVAMVLTMLKYHIQLF